jgi:hypothetical protein
MVNRRRYTRYDSEDEQRIRAVFADATVSEDLKDKLLERLKAEIPRREELADPVGVVEVRILGRERLRTARGGD